MPPNNSGEKKPVGGQRVFSYPQPVPKTGKTGQEARDDSAVRTSGIYQGVRPA